MAKLKKLADTPENEKAKTRYTKADEPETLPGIEKRIRRLQSRLKVLLTAVDSDEKTHQIELTGNEIIFLTRLGNYIEGRQKLDPGQVLTATSASGVQKMYEELKQTLIEYQDDPEFAHVIEDLRHNVSYLRDLMIERKRIERKANRLRVTPSKKRRTRRPKAAAATAGEIIKDGIARKWFTSPDGKKLIKPKRFALKSVANLIFVDEAIFDDIQFTDSPKHTKPGSVFIVLRLLNPKNNVAYQMIEVHANEVLKARQQRLTIAKGLGGTYTAVTLIVRDMNIVSDTAKAMRDATDAKDEDKAERIGEAFLEKHKDDFLSSPSNSIIERDLLRIIDTYI